MMTLVHLRAYDQKSKQKKIIGGKKWLLFLVEYEILWESRIAKNVEESLETNTLPTVGRIQVREEI